MELFDVVRWLLIFLVSVSLLIPINIPLAALAFKIQLGPAEIPFETGEYWWRSSCAALGLTGLGIVTLGIDYFLVTYGIPAGMVHTMLGLVFVPVSVWFLFWIFALEEWTEAVSLFLIYFGIPGLILGLLLLLDFRLPFYVAESWLLPDL